MYSFFFSPLLSCDETSINDRIGWIQVVRTNIFNIKLTKQATVFNKTFQIKNKRYRNGIPVLQLSNYGPLQYYISKE